MSEIIHYDPASSIDRGRLAHALVCELEAAGFTREPRKGGEIIYQQQVSRPRAKPGGARELIDGVFVLVCTSIPARGSLEVRESGADAIRVCAVYRGADRSFGLAKETRVNRTGTIKAIVARTLERARSAWKTALDRPRCRSCGGITFRSRNDKDVCAALCFKSEPAHERAS